MFRNQPVDELAERGKGGIHLLQEHRQKAIGNFLQPKYVAYPNNL